MPDTCTNVLACCSEQTNYVIGDTPANEPDACANVLNCCSAAVEYSIEETEPQS